MPSSRVKILSLFIITSCGLNFQTYARPTPDLRSESKTNDLLVNKTDSLFSSFQLGLNGSGEGLAKVRRRIGAFGVSTAQGTDFANDTGSNDPMNVDLPNFLLFLTWFASYLSENNLVIVSASDVGKLEIVSPYTEESYAEFKWFAFDDTDSTHYTVLGLPAYKTARLIYIDAYPDSIFPGLQNKRAVVTGGKMIVDIPDTWNRKDGITRFYVEIPGRPNRGKILSTSIEEGP